MHDDYASMIEGYDNVEASSGLSNDPLPAGWYALEVADASQRGKTQGGVPYVKMRLRVTEGPLKGRNAFVRLYMGASKVSRKDGNEMVRTPEEFAKARDNVIGQMKGFMKALGLTTGAAIGEGEEKVFAFYNVDAWAGCTFVGRISLQAASVNENTGREYEPSNNLAQYFPVDDAKHGLAWLRTKNNGAHAAPVAYGATV